MSFKPFIVLLLVFCLPGCATQGSTLYQKKPGFYTYILGDVRGSHIDTELQADVYVAPASCQKVITALLAYKSLGGDYRYETKLYVSRKTTPQGPVIQNAWIQFSGDPTLSSEHLLRLLRPLKNRKIHGALILDASFFQTPPYTTNIMVHDLGSQYAQPVSSMNVDHNLITITAKPSTSGKIVHLKNDLGYAFDSSLSTSIDPSAITLAWNGSRIQAKGTMNTQDAERIFQVSPIDMDAYVRRKIARILKKLHIQAKICIIHQQTSFPKQRKPLNTIQSDTLEHILKPALKVSDNLVFDSLYLTLVRKHAEKPMKDWNEGDTTIKTLIQDYFGVSMHNALFVDGSGLSRYNRLQPRALFELLKKAYTMKPFLEAMPSPNEANSTLAKRAMLPSTLKAKTGNILGITCLCGYGTRYKKPKAFVIITHSFAPPLNTSLEVIDKWVAYYLGK